MNALRVSCCALVLLSGCGPSTAVSTELDDPTAVDEAELRALAASEIVGELQPGQPLTVAHPGGAKYRAFRFVAATGPVDLWVRSADGDAKAWLLGDAFQTLTRNDDASQGVSDARLRRTLTRAGTYYVAFREAQGFPATFSVSLDVAGATPTPPSPATPTPAVLAPLSYQRRIFVTRTAYDGDLKAAGSGVDGLDGADRLCAIAAISTNLGGTWKAWLSTSQVRAVDRIAEGGPWVNLMGDVVFANRTGMAVAPLVPVIYDERRGTEWSQLVWSGTTRLLGLATVPGTQPAAPATCRDWTSSSLGDEAGFGVSDSTSGSWTQWEGYPRPNGVTDHQLLRCGTRAHLLCIEQ